MNTRAAFSARVLEFGLIAVLSLAPFFWRVLVGAGDLPAGDAWAYERIFDTYHASGQLRFVGWNDITLVGMIPVTSLWVAITGYGHHQLHLLGSVMCAAAALGFRSLLITFGVARRVPALMLFLGFSGLVGIAGTYLSDPFAITGAVWAVALASRVGITTNGTRPRWVATLIVIGAAVFASFGFLVRQQMLVGAVAAGWLLLGRPRPWPRERVMRFALFAFVFLAISVPFYLWRAGLEHGGEFVFDLHPRAVVSSLQAIFVTQGLLLFATLLWVPGLHPVSKRGSTLVTAVALGMYAAMALSWSRVAPAHGLISGIQEQYGLDGGAWVLIAVLGAAIAGWVWIACACFERRDGRFRVRVDSPLRHPIAPVALLAVAVELAVIITIGAYWTRYSLLMAVASIVVLFSRSVQRSTAAVSITSVLLVASYWELDHSITPTEAIKEAADISACLGIAPEHLDATFSWNGKHYAGIASAYHGDDLESDGLPSTFDRATFPAMKRDAVLTRDHPGVDDTWIVIGPIESSGLIPTTTQTWWLTVRESAITGDQAACVVR